MGRAGPHATDLQSVLPTWLVLADTDSGVGGLLDGELSSTRPQDKHLLPNARTVPGMMHIVSNLLNEVHSGMTHWDTVHAQLKTFDKLLAYKPRRERLVVAQRCVASTPLVAHADLFERSF